MTRLVTDDIVTIGDDWRSYDEMIRGILGVDLLALAAGSIGRSRAEVAASFLGRKLAAISISSGEGLIGGFAESLAAIGRHLGLNAQAMPVPDEEGFRAAEKWGADFLIYADDHRFIAQNTKTGRQADNNPATSEVFVHALELMHNAPLAGCLVVVLGLGIIGFRAAQKLAALGAIPLLYDPCLERSQQTAAQIPQSEILTTETELAAALKKTGLIFDATPSCVAVPFALWPDSAMIVTAPGVPLSWPETWLAPSEQSRLWHDPLQSGTAAMLAYVATN